MFRTSEEADTSIFLCATIDSAGEKIPPKACRQPDINFHSYRSVLFSVIATNGMLGQIFIQHFGGLLEPPYTF